MEIPVKIHFPNFLEDRAKYQSAAQFWVSELEELLLPNKLSWSPFYQQQDYDGNPIFSAWFPQRGKLLRIIQFLPEQGDTLFSAWLDHWQGDFPESLKTPTDSPNSPVPELVLDLAMTNETVLLAKYLIHFWISTDFSPQQMETILAPFKEPVIR